MNNRAQNIVAVYKKKMQRLADKSKGITSITMQAGDSPPITIAKKKAGEK